MTGAIPNPKKTITVDFPLETIKEAVTFIRGLDQKYILHDSNAIFNQYTFSSPEFLSLGVYIDINLSAETESRTEITIEVKRKYGAFDAEREITYANEHIDNILTTIAKGTQLTDIQKQAIREQFPANTTVEVKEGLMESAKGTKKFHCGICRKPFHARRAKNRIIICPHCKASNSLPKPMGCFSIFFMILGAVTILLVLAAIVFGFFT